MGATTSDLAPSEVARYERETNFTTSEIHRLYQRFQRLSKGDSKKLTMDDFLSIPELSMNPLAVRVIMKFSDNKDGEVDFDHFIKTLSIFSIKASKQDKLRFAFDVFDEKGDGFIDREELILILRLMVKTNLKDDQIRKIVDTTISEADTDHDGKISFEEFLAVVESTVLDSKLSLRF